MGYYKNKMIEEQERGFADPGEQYVCADCFQDYAIKECIKNNADHAVCDYCDSSGDDPIAALLELVLSHIMEGIRIEYGDPNDEGVGWEQGWVGATIIDKANLLAFEVQLEVNSDKLLEDILEAITIEEWCKIDPYGDWEHEEYLNDWLYFSEHVKHDVRYVFYKTALRSEEFLLRPSRPHPYEILEYLGTCADECELVRSLPKNRKNYRVRIHDRDKTYSSAKELGTPQKNEAKFSNRMSPAGIPMFYGAFDKETALKETYNPGFGKDKSATIATFKTLRELKVLDLTNTPSLPSIFDEGKRHLRQPLIFLINFIENITREIIKDGREHIEYVPTQVVTEYFKHVYKYQATDKIDGILYPSSKNGGATACVLFVENKNCIDSEDGVKDSNHVLILSNVEKVVIPHKF